ADGAGLVGPEPQAEQVGPPAGLHAPGDENPARRLALGLGAAGAAVEGDAEAALAELRRPDADERPVVPGDTAQARDDPVEQALDGQGVDGVPARRGDD